MTPTNGQSGVMLKQWLTERAMQIKSPKPKIMMQLAIMP
jgi:hypothetical protein